MCWIGETIGYLKGWRTFVVTERGFEISAIAQPGFSQSKTKPRSTDYVTQRLYAPKIRPASLFKPATVRLRPQLPPRIWVFERRKFSPSKHAYIVQQVVLCLFAQRRTNSSSPSGSKVSWSDRPARWLHWLHMWRVFCKQCTSPWIKGEQ